MRNATRLVRPRSVAGDGTGLVSRGGLVWLAETAELSGLCAGFTDATEAMQRRRHDPGRTLTQVVLALADGATALSDVAVLRDQPTMFGPVASDATLWRTFDQIGPVELRGIASARAAARANAWGAGAGPSTETLVIDMDATIIRTKADKQDARPTYKRTYGHHPLLAMVAETGEVLAGKMRPGNAGANCAEDHITVLADAIAQLPEAWRAGHGRYDHADLVEHKVLVRADSAGASHWLTEECRDRNLEFSIGYAIDGRVRDALLCVPDEDWTPARDGNGAAREGAEIVEITDLVDLDAWPDGTRLIVRRERPHPGAQLTVFDTIEGMRHTAFITDQTGTDIAGLELTQRQRARAEAIIRDTKACGLANLPFDCVVSNDVWMQLMTAGSRDHCNGRVDSVGSSLEVVMGQRLSDEVRREVIRLAAQGRTYREIISATGVSMGAVRIITKPLGGVIRPELWAPSSARLSLEDRVNIKLWLEAGESFARIGRRLGRATSTISREVGGAAGREGYAPVACHRRAGERARRPKVSKLAGCRRLSERVTSDLEALWSPEQIAAKLRVEFPDDPEMWVSHETIYKSIFIQGRGELRRELAPAHRPG